MSDLISKSALGAAMYHEAFETDSKMQKWDSGCWIRYKMFENVLASAPTIDAVEVVRCKECKWWDTDGYKDGYGECPNVFHETTADWFCADGERSEE